MELNPNSVVSFCIDHRKLKPGFYISRVDGKNEDIVTYDLRTRKPNSGMYMTVQTMHSVEHMVAAFIRSSDIGDKVIYFGPMGCQTGFYLIVQEYTPGEVLSTLRTVLDEILEYEGPVIGGTEAECGHYNNLSLEAAKKEIRSYAEVLDNIDIADYNYPE